MTTVRLCSGIVCLLGVAALAASATAADSSAAPLRLERIAPVQRTPSIPIDCSGAPDMAGFAAGARARCEAYYAKFAKFLASDGFTPPTQFTFIFREMDGVAYTSGDEVHFAAKFFREHPDDYGAAIHEMVHVIQSYRGRRNPGWLVEGVADYLRFFMYEPVSNRPRPNPDTTDYKRGYREAAAFLAWITEAHQPDLVPRLNAAMRNGTYSEDIWVKETGKTLDQLWEGYKAALRARSSKTVSAAQ